MAAARPSPKKRSIILICKPANRPFRRRKNSLQVWLKMVKLMVENKLGGIAKHFRQGQ
jgi:hypothetical protein